MKEYYVTIATRYMWDEYRNYDHYRITEEEISLLLNEFGFKEFKKHAYSYTRTCDYEIYNIREVL